MGQDEADIHVGLVLRGGVMRIGIGPGINNGTGGVSFHDPFEIGNEGNSTANQKWSDIVSAAGDDVGDGVLLLAELNKHTCHEKGTNGKTWAQGLAGTIQSKLLEALQWCDTNSWAP